MRDNPLSIIKYSKKHQMPRVTFFGIILSVFFHTFCLSQLENSPGKVALRYLEKCWISPISLEGHIGEGEKASSICFDQTGNNLVIGVSKKVLFYNKVQNAIKPYEFGYPVHSVSLDTGVGYLFVSGEGRIDSYHINTGTITNIASQLLKLSDIGQDRFRFSSVQDGMLIASSDNRTFLYDIDHNKVVSHKEHLPFVGEDGCKIFKSLGCKLYKPGSCYELYPILFFRKEGLVCSYSAEGLYPSICAGRLAGEEKYRVEVVKSGKRDNYGTRSILVGGELSDIIRSPVDSEMFMLAYKDIKKGVELQHVEGPSKYVRQCSNLHGPFTFSPDGTEFVCFNGSDLVFLKIAEQVDIKGQQIPSKEIKKIEERQRLAINYAKIAYPEMFLNYKKEAALKGKKVVSLEKGVSKKKKKSGQRKKKRKNRR